MVLTMAADEPVQRPVYLPQGVADPRGRGGYVSSSSGEIVAVELATGGLLWTTRNASKPLIVHEGRLLALRQLNKRGTLVQIVALDAEGAQVLESERVMLPDGVDIDGGEDSTTVEVYVTLGSLVLDWEAHLRYGGGAPPPPYVQERYTKDVRGGVRVHLQSGKVEALRPGETRAAGARLQGEESDSSAVRVWTVGGRDTALLSRVANNEVAYYLKSSGHSQKAPPSEVELVAGEAIVPYVTPDGLYVFFHREGPATTDRGVDNRWLIFSSETAERVAVVTREDGAAQPCVLKPNVYYLLETRVGSHIRCALKAREMSTDRILWERPLSETVVSAPPELRR
ncbi:MAG: hypothetical protein ACJ754_08035 [Pyrinomonadaceae bacterium]